jgi:aminopeptidase-like protein
MSKESEGMRALRCKLCDKIIEELQLPLELEAVEHLKKEHDFKRPQEWKMWFSVITEKGEEIE